MILVVVVMLMKPERNSDASRGGYSSLFNVRHPLRRGILVGVQHSRIWLIGSLTLTGILLVVLFALFLRQGADHDRVLMEFAASQALGRLIDDAAAGNLNTLPESVLGFGIFTLDGTAELSKGSMPERISLPSTSGDSRRGRTSGSGISMVNADVLRLVRSSTVRGMGTPSGGVGPGSRVFAAIDYDVSGFVSERRIRQGALGVLAVLIASFAILSLRLLQKLRRTEAVAQKQQQLAQLGAAARTIAHEIKNPLAAIRLRTGLLRRVVDDANNASLLAIDQEVQRLSRLAEQVRGFLSDPRGTPERLELADFLLAMTDRLPFPVQLDADTRRRNAVVCADRLRLESALMNICTNANQAMEEAAENPGAPVEIDVIPGMIKGMTAVRVLDRGPGIPRELRERVFDPFFTTRTEGSGVGLSSARSFVHAAGGRIRIEDRDGGGAVVSLLLPEGDKACES